MQEREQEEDIEEVLFTPLPGAPLQPIIGLLPQLGWIYSPAIPSSLHHRPHAFTETKLILVSVAKSLSTLRSTARQQMLTQYFSSRCNPFLSSMRCVPVNSNTFGFSMTGRKMGIPCSSLAKTKYIYYFIHQNACKLMNSFEPVAICGKNLRNGGERMRFQTTTQRSPPASGVRRVLRRTWAVPSSYLRRCTLGFWHEIRGCSGAGTTHVRRWWGDGAEDGGAGGIWITTRRSVIDNTATRSFKRDVARRATFFEKRENRV